MYCGDERCTGHHDRNDWATMCPRGKESKQAHERRYYDALTWPQLHLKQLKTRRLRAVQRMRRRVSG